MRTASPYRRRLTIAGQVQGVGFRPFVYRLAGQEGLTGFARNDASGVTVEVQGGVEALDRFAARICAETPPLARIVKMQSENVGPVAGETLFRILKSEEGGGHDVLISPDTSVCPDCLAEMFDPSDRRYLYPFTNCTNCGPRHTITASIPYDRSATTMACFPMCEDCSREYRDPADRRFHAQPNACGVCGPHVWLADAEGTTIAERGDALARCAQLLAQGAVVAIKGLGGFHLACDATSDAAVSSLREGKRRPSKPLAVMVADIETARLLAEIDAPSEALLTGHIRPIVLCPARPNSPSSPGSSDPSGSPVSAQVAPDTDAIGIMLPYTPLHQVLFHHLRALVPAGGAAALVMTSGNFASEPICLGNREAARRLSGIADAYLFHNRDILIRTDDSVVRCLDSPGRVAPALLIHRRARGYAPSPVFLAEGAPSVLGLGPLLKCTVTLTKADKAFVSQHIGDLENLQTYGFYQETIAHMQRILRVDPVLAVRDLHPDYLSTRHAGELDIPSVALQHHVAHIHAVLAENRHQAPALGLALDGTGYGEDGTVWGGEGLCVKPLELSYARLARFTPVPMPGGEAAVREPWRMAQAFLAAIGEQVSGDVPWPWLGQYGQASRLVAQMLEKKVNCPLTSSCGRLFDAVAGLTGVCLATSYEGQAAIMLEHAQDKSETGVYECGVRQADGLIELDTLAIFARAFADWRAGAAAGTIARRFHLGLIGGLVRLATAMAEACGLDVIGLSGGVMHNATVSRLLPEAIERAGLRVLRHEVMPPGDACISLGQAAYGRLYARQRAL